jgi:hypothetical protein
MWAAPRHDQLNRSARVSATNFSKTSLCASQGTHPPRLEFASLFAAEGARGAELLQEHLRENTDDLTVRDIAYALLRMQELGTYDVIADKRLVGLLELRVNGMKNESWRDIALGNLKRLRER